MQHECSWPEWGLSVPFALLQTSWIQCSCPCWILAVGSLQESWPLWQHSLLMSSKHTCSCPPKSTTGLARPLPLSTRWGEFPSYMHNHILNSDPLAQSTAMLGNLLLLKGGEQVSVLHLLLQLDNSVSAFARGWRVLVDQDYRVQWEMLFSPPK